MEKEIEIIKEKITNYINVQDNFLIDFKKFITNKDIDLSIRWDLFFELNLGTHETYIPDFNSIEIDTFTDSLLEWKNKYELVYIVDFFEDVEEFYGEDYDTIRNFKEEVLRKFIKSYSLDW